MGKLAPGSPQPEPRGKPVICSRCNSHEVVKHCESHTCGWVRCEDCKATTGIVKCFGNLTRDFLGWKLRWFIG